MALIIRCRKCRSRIAQGVTACPACGSSVFRFIIDYWPQGRAGGRRKIMLPKETRSLEEARHAEREFLQGRRCRKAAVVDSYAATVETLFPDYLSWYRIRRAPSTVRDLELTWESSLSKIFGAVRVREIGNEHYALYQHSRSGQVKNRTINKELDYFSGFLKWCRREKRIEIPKVDYEKLPCSRPLPIVLSPDEIAAIMKAAKQEPFYHAFFLCLYALGFRFSEVRWLRLADFDFANRAVRVRQKGGTWKLLPLNDNVIKAIKKLAKESRCKPETLLFLTPRAKQPTGPVGDIRAAIRRICKRAGVVKRVTPHIFRHSIATHMLGADVNLRTIQRYLGHKNSATTEFYTTVSMDHLRHAQDQVLQEGSTGKRRK